VKLNGCVCELLCSTCPEVGLKVSGQGIKCMLMSCNQCAGQNCDIKIANSSFDNMAVFEYFAMILTNQNCIYED
jgi:hypothetical protein